MTTFTLGFSPCPNDTFIFDALVNGKIDTDDIRFEFVLEDVQTLNQWAIEKKLAITKLSYGVLPLVLNEYAVLNSGSALGTGVGPLLIKEKNIEIIDVESFAIAIPGQNTTAHLLFSMAYPNAKNKFFLRYNEIERFVAEGRGLGVIIHENRFTYEQKGLEKIIDLGDFWEKRTHFPIPLGGIVIKRSIEKTMQKKVDILIKKSIEYAYKNATLLSPFIKEHAQGMSEDVMRKHIDLYVNDYSLNLGTKGKDAIMQLMKIYHSINPIYQKNAESIFV